MFSMTHSRRSAPRDRTGLAGEADPRGQLVAATKARHPAAIRIGTERTATRCGRAGAPEERWENEGGQQREEVAAPVSELPPEKRAG